MDIKKLLNPKSVAVIGANDKNGFGKSTCTNLLNSPMADHVYFVNPNRDSVLGKKCYRQFSDIPESIDLSVIILNKNLVKSTLEEIAQYGCKAAVIYASGYGETGDRESEKELKELCEKLDLAVMGVNCAGFINNLDGVYAFGMLFNREMKRGNIAIISQSGKLCLNMLQIEYMNYSYLISSGNSTCITVEDYIEYLIEDENTKVIGLYMEGIKDAAKLRDVLKKAALKRKPIVIMKVGRTSKGSALAASHTGSLSGSDKSFDAVCKKFGIIRVDDIEELVQMCHLISVIPMLPGKASLSAMCLSGGETGVCADMGTVLGLEYPEFNEETKKELQGLLPGYATVANPLDMSATVAHDGKVYAKVIDTIMNDPNIGLIICGQTILPKQMETDVIYPMSDGMVMAAGENKKPIVVMSFLNCSRDSVIREKLESVGVPILPATGYGFKLLKYLLDYSEYNPDDHNLSLAIPEKTGGNKISYSEHESKIRLSNFGIKVPEETVFSSEEELDTLGHDYAYPVAAKIASPDILHKSDAGGVKLNIKDAGELKRAFREIIDNAKIYKPDAEIDGVLVQEMLNKGTEVIVGVNNDPQFGPMILCGLGGVFVEIFKEAVICPAPVSEKEAEKMIKSMKGYELLQGFRGSKKGDIKELVNLLLMVSNYAVSNKNILSEIDLNPVFVYPEGEGIAIGDALITEKVKL